MSVDVSHRNVITPTMRPEQEERRALAIHEAGHAVAAWSFRVRIRDIRIEGLQGRVWDTIRLSALHPVTDYKKIVQLAVILLAGEAAEKALLGASDLTCGEHDHLELISIQEMLFPDSPQDAKAWLDARENEARTLVDSQTISVSTLGEALCKRDYISGAEVTNIIENAIATANT